MPPRVRVRVPIRVRVRVRVRIRVRVRVRVRFRIRVRVRVRVRFRVTRLERELLEPRDPLVVGGRRGVDEALNGNLGLVERAEGRVSE